MRKATFAYYYAPGTGPGDDPRPARLPALPEPAASPSVTPAVSGAVQAVPPPAMTAVPSDAPAAEPMHAVQETAAADPVPTEVTSQDFSPTAASQDATPPAPAAEPPIDLPAPPPDEPRAGPPSDPSVEPPTDLAMEPPPVPAAEPATAAPVAYPDAPDTSPAADDGAVLLSDQPDLAEVPSAEVAPAVPPSVEAPGPDAGADADATGEPDEPFDEPPFGTAEDDAPALDDPPAAASHAAPDGADDGTLPIGPEAPAAAPSTEMPSEDGQSLAELAGASQSVAGPDQEPPTEDVLTESMVLPGIPAEHALLADGPQLAASAPPLPALDVTTGDSPIPDTRSPEDLLQVASEPALEPVPVPAVPMPPPPVGEEIGHAPDAFASPPDGGAPKRLPDHLVMPQVAAVPHDVLGLFAPEVITVQARSGDGGSVAMGLPHAGMYRPDDFRPAPWSGLAYELAPADGKGLCAGTRLLTARGEVAVEQLLPSDKVLGLRGPRLTRIAAITRRPVPFGGGADAPVRIPAGTLGADQPTRDLVVGPDQVVFPDGAEPVPARALVTDGGPIAPAVLPHAELFQVMLVPYPGAEDGDVLLADGVFIASRVQEDAAAPG